jgi:hypothetical protein
MKLILILILALSLQVNGQVELKLDSVCADSGATAIVNFTTKNFTNITSFQGSITWDPTKLNFDSTGSYNATLLGLSGGSLNTNSVASGTLGFAWFDNTAAGITLPDNAIILKLYFTPVVSEGVISVNFSNTPTTIEVTATSGIINHTSIPGAAILTNIETLVDGALVTALNDSASYIWLNCDNNNSPIAGAINQSYTVTTNGNYAVQLTENGCVDTSACVMVMSVGIIKTSFPSEIMVYPNPTNGAFSVDLGRTYESLRTTITDIKGNVIESELHNQSDFLNLKINAPTGVYILLIESEDKKAVVRMMKK